MNPAPRAKSNSGSRVGSASPIKAPGSAKLRSLRSRQIERLEAIITDDRGGRGLAADPLDNLVTRCRGNLAGAARDVARNGATIAIVTGFYVAHAAVPAIETDGPSGAIALAWLLARLGLRVRLITDPLGAPAISAGAAAAKLDPNAVPIDAFPFEDEDPASASRSSNDSSVSRRAREFVESFFRAAPANELTHLVAIERAGPSHDAATAGLPAGADFSRLCPLDHQNHVHNFRGRIITPFTAKTHLLFDFIRENNLPVRTIGIGDGGNEIGMGSIPWWVFDRNISSGLGARIACRVATDWTICCGVSNWGAYALGAAVACLRGRGSILDEWSDDRERTVLESLVAAGAVDGVTARRELSVDGLPLEQHLNVWRRIRDAAREDVETGG